ncbi:unnamed protein product [Pieris brassicae]|uniref:Uncharacterized protein n=1 Tax=Pieris brassicae TaxID=7116 RepID=A0A9P0WZL8_PIEBR|nr:unnamed protein product [Pieris brassicae]
MEHNPRRRRGRTRATLIQTRSFAPKSKISALFDSLCNLLIMSSLMGVIFLSLEHHCNVCRSKCDVFSIAKELNDISNNLTDMKNSYTYLESRILKFSEELPKIEGQVDILEALANTIERGNFGWNPKTHLALPNVDVFLNGDFKVKRANKTKISW